VTAAYLPQNFLGLPEPDATYERARVVVLPVPYDSTTSYGAGARFGPAAILEASRQVELYDDELGCTPADVGVHTLAPLLPVMSGPEGMIDAVADAAAPCFADGKLMLMLGGEHSVSVGTARACARAHGRLSILQIDAHADLRDSYEGTPFSHACAARRLLDFGEVIAVGIRNLSAEEQEFATRTGRRIFWARDIARDRDDRWIDEVVASLKDPVYVTFDLDGLDPAVIPATGTPEPGGLGWYQTLALLRRVGEARRVVACDVVELAPAPGSHVSDFAAAKLGYKMIGYFAR
jgi:agmatinase